MFNRESGEPGSTDTAFIRWHLHEDGTHSGAGQWDPPTWEEGGGRTDEAWEATPDEQTRVFNRFYPGHESRWAETAPFC